MPDGMIKATLTFKELEYGKYEAGQDPALVVKLIIVAGEQIAEKCGRKSGEGSVDIPVDRDSTPLKEAQLLDDAASQSSNSSQCKSSRGIQIQIQMVAASELEQKSVRAFKDSINEQKNPFFARCFVKLGVLIFFIVLSFGGTSLDSLAVVECVLIEYDMQFVERSFSHAYSIYTRRQLIRYIPNSFRTIYNIYQRYEPPSSEIFPERIAVGLAMVPPLRSDLVDLREPRATAASDQRNRRDEPSFQPRSSQATQPAFGATGG